VRTGACGRTCSGAFIATIMGRGSRGSYSD
jgi:hypothetical protein